jgi:hypothetical protein
MGYGLNTNWYMDTGATDHITGEIEKLTTHDKYHGGDQVQTASSSCMEIQHVGHGVLCSPRRDLHLKNILHVPSSSKDLLSVHRIANDNNLNFILNTFVLRTRRRGGFFSPGHVKMVSIQWSLSIKPRLESPSFQHPCGIIG